MGRKQMKQRKGSGKNKTKNAKISKNGHSNARRTSGFNKNGFNKNNNFKGQQRSNKNFNKFNRNKVEHHENKQKPDNVNKKIRNNKKSNLGQYSKLVGKSLFKMVPEGQDNKNKKNKLSGFEKQKYQQQDDQQKDIQDQDFQDQDQNQNQQLQQDEQQQIDEPQEYQNQEEEQAEQQDQNNQEINDQQIQYPSQNDEDQFQGADIQNQQIDEQIENQQNVQENGQQIDEQQDQNVDISVINLRIQQTLQILMNMPKLGQGKPRKYFLDKLKAYTHRYYGYNFQLIDHFLGFLNPTEMVQFFEANQTQRPLTIRTNTLKTRRKQLAQALIQRGVNLDPLAQWSKVGIKIYQTKVPIGATPEYLAGHYMLQSASSFLPVLALDPQMNEAILDMASAPGGKTSYISQIMKNTGAVFANDLKKDRLKALQFNIHRLGISNVVITCRDGRKYPQIFPNKFDRVLLDAPCTGLGIISKDHSIKANRVLIDIYKNSHVQKQLLLAAIDSAKVGGVIVYSTCSVSPLQNQQVINYALKKRNVSIVDIDDLVQVGEPGLTKFNQKRYHIDLRKTKRIYPHIHNMDGFYLGKLVKFANGTREDQTQKQKQRQELAQQKKKNKQESVQEAAEEKKMIQQNNSQKKITQIKKIKTVKADSKKQQMKPNQIQDKKHKQIKTNKAVKQQKTNENKNNKVQNKKIAKITKN